MSDMDYEKAWKDLKDDIAVLEGGLILFAKEGLPEMQSALITVEAILHRMEMIETEMTTVRDDDGQSA